MPTECTDTGTIETIGFKPQMAQIDTDKASDGLHRDLSHSIIGAAMDVLNELGRVWMIWDTIPGTFNPWVLPQFKSKI